MSSPVLIVKERHEKRAVAHALTFVLVLGAVLLIPVLRQWPWIWAVPLVIYGILVAFIPPLRLSLGWVRCGEFSLTAVALAVAMMAVTFIALVTFNVVVRPETQSFKEALPLQLLGGGILAAIVFSTLNATMEEVIFRGLLFDALVEEYPLWFAVVVTSLLFGLGHLRGYPPGVTGALLAAVFGAMMAVLRIKSGGLALAVLVHIGADLTICAIVLR